VTDFSQFEGGTLDGWAGVGFDQCAVFLNNDFERVYYKNAYAAGVKIINYYMVRVASPYARTTNSDNFQMYGATNWGNLGYPGS